MLIGDHHFNFDRCRLGYDFDGQWCTAGTIERDTSRSQSQHSHSTVTTQSQSQSQSQPQSQWDHRGDAGNAAHGSAHGSALELREDRDPE